MWVRIPLFSLMRLANHIILNFEKVQLENNSFYWASSFLSQKNTPLFLRNLDNVSIAKHFFKKPSNDIKRLTLKSSFEETNLGLNKTIQELGRLDEATCYSNSTLHNSVNLNFLRKERAYTKLKYSRTPGYDIVSGGSAVLLAGFLGFLVSEKFGIELVDSGDFYYLWMYIVFLCFSVRPLLVTSSEDQSFFTLLSIRYLIVFISDFITLLFKLIKRLLK